MNNYGYVRVSTKEQFEDRQITALEETNISFKKIYVDKRSGKDFERPQYKRLIRILKEGDVVFIKSIDRLGRNYDEIIEQWQLITKKIKADIVILDMPLLDTRNKEVGLTGKFVADLVLQILSYVAQTERESIKQRQKEGIAAAKKRGVKFGPKHKPIPEGFEEMKNRWLRKEITIKVASATLGIPPSTFHRWCKENNKEPFSIK